MVRVVVRVTVRVTVRWSRVTIRMRADAGCGECSIALGLNACENLEHGQQSTVGGATSGQLRALMYWITRLSSALLHPAVKQAQHGSYQQRAVR